LREEVNGKFQEHNEVYESVLVVMVLLNSVCVPTQELAVQTQELSTTQRRYCQLQSCTEGMF